LNNEKGVLTVDEDNQDSFKVYCEQTCHHPPISHLLIENELVEITGNLELKGAMSRNNYLINNTGKIAIKFKDTKQTIKFEFPRVTFSGLIVVFGQSTLDITSSLIMIDEGNKIKGHINFGKD